MFKSLLQSVRFLDNWIFLKLKSKLAFLHSVYILITVSVVL